MALGSIQPRRMRERQVMPKAQPNNEDTLLLNDNIILIFMLFVMRMLFNIPLSVNTGNMAAHKYARRHDSCENGRLRVSIHAQGAGRFSLPQCGLKILLRRPESNLAFFGLFDLVHGRIGIADELLDGDILFAIGPYADGK